MNGVKEVAAVFVLSIETVSRVDAVADEFPTLHHN